MFKNTFQSGFLSILYSIGSKPLQIWDKKGEAPAPPSQTHACYCTSPVPHPVIMPTRRWCPAHAHAPHRSAHSHSPAPPAPRPVQTRARPAAPGGLAPCPRPYRTADDAPRPPPQCAMDTLRE